MIETKRVVSRGFGEDMDEHRRGEQATMIAARLIARDGRGARATADNVSALGGNGHDEDFVAIVEQMLALFAAEEVDYGWRNKHTALFTRTTGEHVGTPLAEMMVFEAVHRARAIA
ncbi:hypothetical protein [Pseudoroseicyclus tamaricis]|uniref:Uncharacterized protein n=1 Tax=Pseudoroseicyclus tamaricis TaxID=2705421 RepID=A0A6B2JYZ0_9RHOB|nr:hypothetical protein [Pseudoroseicyclus tamaricis]NDV00592.1 hypothetical protein [Pseudoroseicyclus tamaricis]